MFTNDYLKFKYICMNILIMYNTHIVLQVLMIYKIKGLVASQHIRNKKITGIRGLHSLVTTLEERKLGV